MGAALLACAVRASDAVEDGVLTLDESDAGRTLQAALAARSLALADLSSVTSLVIDCVNMFFVLQCHMNDFAFIPIHRFQNDFFAASLNSASQSFC